MTQAAARTLALVVPELGVEFERNLHVSLTPDQGIDRPATRHRHPLVGVRRTFRRLPFGGPNPSSIHVQGTDGLLVAHATHRLGQQLRDRQHADPAAGLAASPQRDRVGHDQLVERGARRSAPPRGPDSTGCVMYATTRTAPCSFSACAAWHSVPAVSTRSSTSTQRPAAHVADDVHHLRLVGALAAACR